MGTCSVFGLGVVSVTGYGVTRMVPLKKSAGLSPHPTPPPVPIFLPPLSQAIQSVPLSISLLKGWEGLSFSTALFHFGESRVEEEEPATWSQWGSQENLAEYTPRQGFFFFWSEANYSLHTGGRHRRARDREGAGAEKHTGWREREPGSKRMDAGLLKNEVTLRFWHWVGSALGELSLGTDNPSHGLEVFMT